jgi:hypothetical protein
LDMHPIPLSLRRMLALARGDSSSPDRILPEMLPVCANTDDHRNTDHVMISRAKYVNADFMYWPVVRVVRSGYGRSVPPIEGSIGSRNCR